MAFGGRGFSRGKLMSEPEAGKGGERAQKRRSPPFCFTRVFNIAGIPTIVLSGSPSELPAGARDLLAKPVDIERLLALIDQYC